MPEIQILPGKSREEIFSDALDAYHMGTATKAQKLIVSLSLTYQLLDSYPELRDPEISDTVSELLTVRNSVEA